MQLTDKDGNVFGTGGLEITSSDGKPKMPVINTDITIGTTPIVNGVVGRILFQGIGNVVQESENLTWDNTNSIFTLTRLLGPTMRLNVQASNTSKLQFTQELSVGVPTEIGYISNQFGTGMILQSYNSIYFNPGNVERMRFAPTTGNVLIGTTTDAGFKLDVNGTARVTNLKIDPVGTINFSSPTVSSQQSSISSTDGNKLLLSSSFWNTVSAGQSIGLNATYVRLSGTSGASPTVGLTFVRGSTPIAENTTFHFGQSFSEAIGITGRARGATQFFINRNIDASTARLIDFQEFGTSRFIVNSTGNVLIGSTTDAGYKLDVNGSARIAADLVADTLGALSGATVGYLNLVGSVSIINKTQTLYIPLLTRNTTGSEVVYDFSNIGSITATGNVGIGSSTAPYYPLQITQSTINNYIELSGTTNKGIYASGSGLLNWDPSGNMNFYTGGVNLRATISSVGNFLIGTSTDAGYKLDVTGTIRSTGTNGLILSDGTYAAKTWMNGYIYTIEKEGSYGISTYQLKYNDTTDALYLSSTSIRGDASYGVVMSRSIYAPHNGAFGFLTYGTTTQYSAIKALYTDNNSSGIAFNYKTANVDTEAMRITSTGNVGIGTTSPTSILDAVVSNGAKSGLRFRGYSDASTPYLLSLGTYTYSDIFQITSVNGLVSLNNTSLYALALGTNNTERLRITSTGNVLIGTSTDSGYKLNVNGSVYFQNTGTSAVTHTLLFRNENSSYGGLTIASSGLPLTIFQASGYGYLTATGFSINSTNSTIWTNNGSLLDIKNAAGNTTYVRLASTTGNVLINTTTDAGYKLDVTGTTRISSYLAIDGNNGTGAGQLFLKNGANDYSTQIGTNSYNLYLQTRGTSNGFNFWFGSSARSLSINGGGTGDIEIVGSASFSANGLRTIYHGSSAITIQSDNYNNGDGVVINRGRSTVATDPIISFQDFGTEKARINRAGNVLIGTTTDNGYKLEVNGTGYFGSNLRVNGTITASTPTANTYICHIGLTADQVIVSGADAVLDFVDIADTNNWYDPTTKKFLPTVAGYYHVDFSLWFEPSPVSTGQYNIQVRKNGTTVMIAQQPTINNGTGQSLMSSKLVYFNGTTDYIDFTAYQSTGSNRNILKGTDSSGTYATIFLLAV